MKLKCITKLNVEKLANLVPENIYILMDCYSDIFREILMYVAIEDDGENVIGNAVYGLYSMEMSSATCFYLGVKDEYKGFGYEEQILKESIEDLRKRGQKNSLIIWDSDDGKENIPAKCGMEELCKSIYVGYTIGQLRAAGVAQKMADNGMFKNVKCYGELSEITKRKFRKDLLSKSYNLRDEKMDKEYSRFFVVNDEIHAYIAVHVHEGEIIDVISYGIEAEEKNKMAYALMIFSLVDVAINKFSDDGGFVIEFYEEKLVDAMKKAFGEPEGVEMRGYWGYRQEVN